MSRNRSLDHGTDSKSRLSPCSGSQTPHQFRTETISSKRDAHSATLPHPAPIVSPLRRG